jgi:hypothetical protein
MVPVLRLSVLGRRVQPDPTTALSLSRISDTTDKFPQAKAPSQPQQPPPRHPTHHRSKCRFPRLPTLNRGQNHQRFPGNIPTRQAFHDPPQHTRVQSFEHRHPIARILPQPQPWWSTTLRRTHLKLPLYNHNMAPGSSYRHYISMSATIL